MTLWDTGCSHDIVNPVFAEELLRRGARWRECAPLHLNHGDAEHVKAGTPPTRQICANILLVHKGKIFERRDAWLYVYEGGLPDVMLSEGFLNAVPCVSHPGVKLIDTREGVGDRELLRQTMRDYQDLVVRRYTHPECTTSDLHFAHINVALADLRLGGDSNAQGAQQTPAPRTATEAPTTPETRERIQKVLAEMEAQRARLRQRLGKPVSDEALQAAQSVLEKYPACFRPPGSDACNLAVFRLKLKDNTKFHIALPRRTNPIVLADMRRQIEELLLCGAIERCHTTPSSVYAVVMAKRPGQPGKYRLCIDLVKLNENTMPMPYAMPDVHEALDRLSGKKYYSSFDFSSWFQQFEIAEEDRNKVAFIIPGDNVAPPQIYQWKKMCFGLLNAGYWSQRQLQEALEKFKGCEGIYPFVDDVVIASDSLEEHLEKLDAFMRFCQHHNIRIKKEKVELVTGAIKHLGCILSDEGQALDPARIDSLLGIGAPSNLKGLKSLLGSFSFIRGWIAGMADTAAPLTDLMGAQAKRMGFQWGAEQEEALKALKEACQLAPALGAPDYTKPFEVSMDASDVGVGAVLWQWQVNEKGERVPQAIMYCSRRFSARERRWQISERELFAVKYALEKFKTYLRGYPHVTLHTDHLNLVTGLYTHASPKIERWRMFIESCRPFKIQHVKGTDATQQVADGLSRLHVANLALSATPDELDEEANLQAELGEGGMDTNMFDTHTCTVAHAWAGIINNTHARQLASELDTAKVISPEEAAATKERQERYGIGCDLLRQMGWTVTEEKHRRMDWEANSRQEASATSTRRRPGLGYAAPVRAKSTAKPQATVQAVLAPLEDCEYVGCIHSTMSRTDCERVSDITSQPTTARCAPIHARKHSHDRRHKPKTRRTTIDTTALAVANLVCALPDIQERGSVLHISSKVMRGRRFDQRHNDIEHLQGVRREGEGDPRRTFSASGCCNAMHASETQTDVEDFRQAGRKWRGGFPDEALLRRCHDETHPSFPVTWRRVVRATGIGPGLEQAKLKQQVRHFCDACLTCQKLQPARARVAARQGTIRKRPFGELAFDTIVLNTPDVDGNRYILVVIDSFSRAVELFPMKRATADVVTTCLHDVLCRWGKPHQVRCDNAKAFAAAVTQQLLKRARVKQHFTAPYSHNSNGQVENANRRVMEILRAMILDDRLGPQTHLQWSLLLPAVRRVMMSRMVLQHGCCPNDLAYMFSPENEDSIFADEAWMPELREPAEENASELIADLLRKHEILRDACEQKQDEHLAKLAALHDMEAADVDPLQPGDFVLVDMRERPHTKITSPWSGPWQVVEQRDDNDTTHPMMTLQHIASKKIERFNASMCKRCNLDLFEKLEEAISYAAMDNFEYEIEAILDHAPRGERKRKRRDTYEFQVLWRGIERSEDNPSWEPYCNESLRASEPFATYCRRADVQAELGRDFLTDNADGAPAKTTKKSKAAAADALANTCTL